MIEKHNIKNGDYFIVHNYPFKQGFNPLAWFIQLSCRYFYHHCSIYFDGYMYESKGKGFVKTYTVDSYIKRIGVEIEVIHCRKNVYVTRGDIQSNLNLPYDYVGTLFYQLLRQITNNWYGGVRDKKANCSGIIMKIFKKDKWWEYDPQDVAREAFENDEVLWVSNPEKADKVNKFLNR